MDPYYEHRRTLDTQTAGIKKFLSKVQLNNWAKLTWDVWTTDCSVAITVTMPVVCVHTQLPVTINKSIEVRYPGDMEDGQISRIAQTLVRELFKHELDEQLQYDGVPMRTPTHPGVG